MSDPLQLLQRLRVNVLTRPLSDDCALWLQHGIDAYMTGELWTDIKGGIIRGVSVGYTVDTWEPGDDDDTAPGLIAPFGPGAT